MDTTKLTPEERNALIALVRSPGWVLLMEKLFLPQMQLATRFLDRPQAEQADRADYLRGIKASYANLIDVAYHIAGIKSPLELHALGLLSTIRNSVEYGVTSQVSTSVSTVSEKKGEHEEKHRRRSSFPV